MLLADYGLIAAVIAVIGAVITIATTIFSLSIINRINNEREDLNSKVDKLIDDEIENYKKEKPTNKRTSLRRITILENFRTTLGKSEDILNFGYLYMIFALIYLIAILIIGQYIPISINAFFSNHLPFPQAVFLLLCEFLIFVPFPAFSKFSMIWKLGRVHTRHYHERDEDLSKIIFTFFEAKPLFAKSQIA